MSPETLTPPPDIAEAESFTAPDSEEALDSLDQPDQDVELAPDTPEHELTGEQLDLVAKYVNSMDGKNGQAPGPEARVRNYKKAMELMKDKHGSGEAGLVAITASTVGNLTRSPGEFERSGVKLTKDMIERVGMPKEQAKMFFEVQKMFLKAQSPEDYARILKTGIKRLDASEEQTGEDLSLLRTALMTSALGAAQERSLQQAIHKELKQ